MRETFERLLARISPQRRQTLIVALGLAGLALILLSSLLPEKPEEKDGAQERSAVSSTADGSREQLESELASMLSSIEGAGAVRVMITMDTTAEDVYAVDRTASEGSSAADGASRKSSRVAPAAMLRSSIPFFSNVPTISGYSTGELWGGQGSINMILAVFSLFSRGSIKAPRASAVFHVPMGAAKFLNCPMVT